MTEEERASEAQELQERFGPGLVELMRKRRAARQGAGSNPVQGGGPVTVMDSRNDGFSKRSEADKVYAEVDEENQVRVEGMDAEERLGEIQELQERFGSTVLDALRKRGEARLQSKVSPEGSGPGVNVSGMHIIVRCPSKSSASLTSRQHLVIPSTLKLDRPPSPRTSTTPPPRLSRPNTSRLSPRSPKNSHGSSPPLPPPKTTLHASTFPVIWSPDRPPLYSRRIWVCTITVIRLTLRDTLYRRYCISVNRRFRARGLL